MKYWLWLGGLAFIVLWFLSIEETVVEMVSDNTINIRISEIMVKGTSKNLENIDGQYDFIELHNYGELSIDLTGYGLSDDPKEPFKWVFEDEKIEAGGYMLLIADSEGVETAYTNVGFAINSGKEGVYLTHPDETLLSKVLPNHIKDNLSYGFHETSKSYKWLVTPTPGYENSLMYVEDNLTSLQLPIPKVNHPTGAYEDNLLIDVAVKEGEILYYTLDGSLPTEGDFRYEGPFELSVDMNPNDYAGDPTISYMTPKGSTWGRPKGPVYKGVVLRLMAYKPGIGTSDVATYTYFIDPEFDERYSLPIVSLVGDPMDFFDHDTGIYVLGQIFQDQKNSKPQGDTPANYNQRGIEWEKPVDFTLMSNKGQPLYQQQLGVRVHGAWSRANPHKGIRLFAREEYGQATFDYPLFDGLVGEGNGESITSFSRFLLRASGNDWNYTLFRDAMMQDISTVTPFRHVIDHQAYQPTIVFLNGEYWGIHNLRETVDAYKIASHYSLNPEEITIAEGNNAEGKTVVDVGDDVIAESYNDLIQKIKDSDVSDDTTYEEVVKAIDVENFAQYMMAQTFLGNTDWPGNNIRYWRVNKPDETGLYGHDGRWRYILFDTDFGFQVYEGMENDVTFDSIGFAMAENGPLWPNPDWSTVLFRKLLEQPEFKFYFVNGYASMLNTSFKSLYIHKSIVRYRDGIIKEISEHNNRYSNLDGWSYEVDRLHNFATRRDSVMWDLLQKHFNTGKPVEVMIDSNIPEGCTVYMDQFKPLEWSVPYQGQYFEGIPINISIELEEGYRFVRWDGLEDASMDQLIYPTEGQVIKAIIEKE